MSLLVLVCNIGMCILCYIMSFIGITHLDSNCDKGNAFAIMFVLTIGALEIVNIIKYVKKIIKSP